MSHDLCKDQTPEFFRKPILDYLVHNGVINTDQRKILLLEQVKKRVPISQLIIDLNIMSDQAWIEVLAQYTNVDIFNPQTMDVDFNLMQHIPKDDLQRLHIIPIKLIDNKLHALVTDPEDVKAFDVIIAHFQKVTLLVPLLVTEIQFDQILNDLFDATPSTNNG